MKPDLFKVQLDLTPIDYSERGRNVYISRLTPKRKEFCLHFPSVLPGAGIGYAQAVCLMLWHKISSTCICFKLCFILPYYQLNKNNINVFISFCRVWDY